MLTVLPRHRDGLAARNLLNLSALHSHYADQPIFSDESAVRIHLGPLPSGDTAAGTVETFYKEYRFRRPSWRFWGRASKARREFQNLRRMIDLGIPCAEPIACGEQRDVPGRLIRAFIITRAVPAALSMEQFLARHCPDADNPAHVRLRRLVLDQLAPMVARIHRAGFAHNDLHWRNVLVVMQSDGSPQVWWIDCPRGRKYHLPRLADRKFRKDLATLDRTAATCCSLRERLRFACRYHRAAGSGESLRQLVRQVNAYRLRRWRHAEAPIPRLDSSTPNQAATAERGVALTG